MESIPFKGSPTNKPATFDDKGEKETGQKQCEQEVYKVLDELRQAGYFCDATIQCSGQTFKVQRNILSTCSPYFRALFTYNNPVEGTAERCKTMKEFHIQDVPPDVMELLIKYAYTRDVPKDLQTIVHVLPAADRFQMEGLLKACGHALAQELTVDNCMQIRAAVRAFSFSCKELKGAADKFLLENFPWIYCFSPEFLQLEVDDLYEILGNDKLNVRNEGITLDAVCRWVSCDFEHRYVHTERLLRQVRLGIISNEAFFTILNYHKLTAASPAVHTVLLDASRLMGQPEVISALDQCSPRLPTDLVFVFGGSNMGWPLQIVEAFDIRSLTWKEIPTPEFVMNQVVYIIGGFDGADYINYCTAFHPDTAVWSDVSPMHDKRCYVSVAVLDGYMYALGGFDGRVRQRSAERYHPASNQWTMIQPMICPRSDGGAVALDGKIYMIGGFNGQESLSSAEYYDPSCGQWTMIHTMRDRRSGVGVVAHKGLLYAAGGFNGSRRLSSVERYHPDTDEWHPIQPMLNARSNFAMCVIEDALLVVGGYGGRHTTARVEILDLYGDRWSISTELSYSRSALSACVVSGLPNVEMYTSRFADSALDLML